MQILTDKGGTFDLTMDAGTEFLLSGAGGPQYHLSSSWSVELALQIDCHFADWEVRDRVSSNTGTVGSYTTIGSYLGVSYRF